MLTAAQIILEYVCPICGIITGNLMFFAPFADARKAALSKYNLADLNPTPWAFMLGNCFGWVTYGILLHNYFVFFANVFGFVLSVWLNMVAVKLKYCDHRSREMINSIVGVLKKQQEELKSKNQLLLLQQAACKKKNDDHVINDGDDENAKEEDCVDVPIEENEHTSTTATEQAKEFDARNITSNANNSSSTDAIEYEQLVWNVTLEATTPAPAPHERLVMGMVLFWTCIVAIIALFGAKSFTANTRQLIVGIAVNLNLVFFYAAPLSSIFKVVSTRSCSSIHVPTMITNTANGAFWCAYGVAVMDPFIAVPNALGSLLGVVQILLCIIFPRRPIAAAAAAAAAATTTATAGEHKDGNESAPSTDEETGVAIAAAAASAATTTTPTPI